jgi:lipopolysaccharide/colanic/teichoic acid biosynthesis glycosyltransferase
LHRISSESISASGSASLTDHAVAPNRSVLVPPTPVAESAGRTIQLALKRAIDVVGSGLGLLLLAPLMITLAILIRAGSNGPVFFRQTRTGLDGRPFEILKFRSMYTDRCDISGVAQTVKDDPRVTPIGRVMRRTNLDELPQLINVLRGDMSLVGPRPHVPGMLAAGILYEDLVPGYEQRHRMRPGITGLAQVNGLRGPTIERKPAVDRVMNDFAYVREFSLWLDIKILVKTLASELRGGTGY